MKKQYTTPEIDVRKYEVLETLSAATSRTDDGEIDLDLNPAAGL